MSRTFAILFCSAILLTTTVNSLSHGSPASADEAGASKKATAEGDPETDRPLLSVVLLQKKLPSLTEKHIADSIQKAWKQKVNVGDGGKKDATDFVVKGGPGFVIQCQQTRCMVILDEKPYLEAEAFKDVQELRTRKMLQEHKTWLSLDLIGDTHRKSAAEQEQAMNRIIQLAVEMADRNTVGVLLPSEKIVLPMSDEILAAMKADQALKALRKSSNAAVIGASGDDPKMLAATAEARRTWSEFVKAFRNKPKNSENFSAKFPFDAPDQKEFMWVEVDSINGDTVTGRLGNDPVWVKDLKLGDEVRMKVSDLSDWMYLKDGEIVGGYTVKVLMEKQQQGNE
ncbi:MAG: DUF2314 domain-containing protein [Planctomycetaceae bacterium]